MRVFAYLQDLPGGQFGEERPLAEAWRAQWIRQGWNAVLLSEQHARRHPEFELYAERAASFSGITPVAYRVATWVRWLAFAQVIERGETALMVDYDVFNRGFKVEDAMALARRDRPVNLSGGNSAMPIMADQRQAQTIPTMLWMHSHWVQRHPTRAEMHDDPWMQYVKHEGVGLVAFADPYPCGLHGITHGCSLVHVASATAGGGGAKKLAIWQRLEAEA